MLRRKERGNFRLLIRTTALALSLTTALYGQTVLAAPLTAMKETAATPTPFLDPFHLSLPASIGSVKETFRGTGDKTLFIIQDAHAIPDAQRNIQKLIVFLQERYGVPLVALEGASSALDPRIFRSFPDPKLLKKVFEEYFEQGELAGGTAAAIFPAPLDGAIFHGVEDWNLYEDGLGHFLEAEKMEKDLLNQLNGLFRELNAEKEKIYSRDLLEIDRALANFRKNTLDLGGVLEKLAAVRPPDPESELALLLEEVRKSRENRPSLEAEVKRVAGKVGGALKKSSSPAARRDRVQFNQRFQEFQTSQITPEVFALFLKGLARRHRVRVGVSGSLHRLVDRQRRIKDIEGTKFFDQFELYARSVKAPLFRGEEDRRLEARGRELERLERLARLELSRGDWNEMKEALRRMEYWNVTRDGVAGEGDVARLLRRMRPHLDFYRNAGKRDGVFIEKIEALLQKHRARSAIFLAGGFHAEGVTRALQTKGASYVLIQPAIAKVPEETAYRKHMQGEVSWADYFEVKNGRVNLYEAFVRGTRDRLLSVSAVIASPNSPAGPRIGAKQSQSPEIASSALRPPRNDIALLKPWRDQIIRDLANEGRVAEAGAYTRFLDEISPNRHPERSLPAGEAGEGSLYISQWQANVHRFIAGLRRLNARGQINEQNLTKLFQQANVPAPAPGPASVSPDAELRVALLPFLRNSSPDLHIDESQALPRAKARIAGRLPAIAVPHGQTLAGARKAEAAPPRSETRTYEAMRVKKPDEIISDLGEGEWKVLDDGAHNFAFVSDEFKDMVIKIVVDQGEPDERYQSARQIYMDYRNVQENAADLHDIVAESFLVDLTDEQVKKLPPILRGTVFEELKFLIIQRRYEETSFARLARSSYQKDSKVKMSMAMRIFVKEEMPPFLDLFFKLFSRGFIYEDSIFYGDLAVHPEDPNKRILVDLVGLRKRSGAGLTMKDVLTPFETINEKWRGDSETKRTFDVQFDAFLSRLEKANLLNPTRSEARQQSVGGQARQAAPRAEAQRVRDSSGLRRDSRQRGDRESRSESRRTSGTVNRLGLPRHSGFLESFLREAMDAAGSLIGVGSVYGPFSEWLGGGPGKSRGSFGRQIPSMERGEQRFNGAVAKNASKLFVLYDFIFHLLPTAGPIVALLNVYCRLRFQKDGESQDFPDLGWRKLFQNFGDWFGDFSDRFHKQRNSSTGSGSQQPLRGRFPFGPAAASPRAELHVDLLPHLARLKAEFDPTQLPNLKVKGAKKPLGESYRNLILTHAFQIYGETLIDSLIRSEGRQAARRAEVRMKIPAEVVAVKAEFEGTDAGPFNEKNPGQRIWEAMKKTLGLTSIKAGSVYKVYGSARATHLVFKKEKGRDALRHPLVVWHRPNAREERQEVLARLSALFGFDVRQYPVQFKAGDHEGIFPNLSSQRRVTKWSALLDLLNKGDLSAIQQSEDVTQEIQEWFEQTGPEERVQALQRLKNQAADVNTTLLWKNRLFNADPSERNLGVVVKEGRPEFVLIDATHIFIIPEGVQAVKQVEEFLEGKAGELSKFEMFMQTATQTQPVKAETLRGKLRDVGQVEKIFHRAWLALYASYRKSFNKPDLKFSDEEELRPVWKKLQASAPEAKQAYRNVLEKYPGILGPLMRRLAKAIHNQIPALSEARRSKMALLRAPGTPQSGRAEARTAEVTRRTVRLYAKHLEEKYGFSTHPHLKGFIGTQVLRALFSTSPFDGKSTLSPEQALEALKLSNEIGSILYEATRSLPKLNDHIWYPHTLRLITNLWTVSPGYAPEEFLTLLTGWRDSLKEEEFLNIFLDLDTGRLLNEGVPKAFPPLAEPLATLPDILLYPGAETDIEWVLDEPSTELHLVDREGADGKWVGILEAILLKLSSRDDVIVTDVRAPPADPDDEARLRQKNWKYQSEESLQESRTFRIHLTVKGISKNITYHFGTDIFEMNPSHAFGARPIYLSYRVFGLFIRTDGRHGVARFVSNLPAGSVVDARFTTDFQIHPRSPFAVELLGFRQASHKEFMDRTFYVKTEMITLENTWRRHGALLVAADRNYLISAGMKPEIKENVLAAHDILRRALARAETRQAGRSPASESVPGQQAWGGARVAQPEALSKSGRAEVRSTESEIAKLLLEELKSSVGPDQRSSVSKKISLVVSNQSAEYQGEVFNPRLFIREFVESVRSAPNLQDRLNAIEALKSSLSRLSPRSFGSGLYEFIPEIEMVTNLFFDLLDNPGEGGEELSKNAARFLGVFPGDYPWLLPNMFKRLAELKKLKAQAASQKNEAETDKLDEQIGELEHWLRAGPAAASPFSNDEFQTALGVTSPFTLPLMGIDSDDAQMLYGLPETVEDYFDLNLKTMLYLGRAASGDNLYHLRNLPDPLSPLSHRYRVMILLWEEFVQEMEKIGAGFEDRLAAEGQDAAAQTYFGQMQTLLADYIKLVEMLFEGGRRQNIGNLGNLFYGDDETLRRRAGRWLFWLGVFENNVATDALQVQPEMLKTINAEWEQQNDRLNDEYGLFSRSESRRGRAEQPLLRAEARQAAPRTDVREVRIQDMIIYFLASLAGGAFALNLGGNVLWVLAGMVAGGAAMAIFWMWRAENGAKAKEPQLTLRQMFWATSVFGAGLVLKLNDLERDRRSIEKEVRDAIKAYGHTGSRAVLEDHREVTIRILLEDAPWHNSQDRIVGAAAPDILAKLDAVETVEDLAQAIREIAPDREWPRDELVKALARILNEDRTRPQRKIGTDTLRRIQTQLVQIFTDPDPRYTPKDLARAGLSLQREGLTDHFPLDRHLLPVFRAAFKDLKPGEQTRIREYLSGLDRQAPSLHPEIVRTVLQILGRIEGQEEWLAFLRLLRDILRPEDKDTVLELMDSLPEKTQRAVSRAPQTLETPGQTPAGRSEMRAVDRRKFILRSLGVGAATVAGWWLWQSFQSEPGPWEEFQMEAGVPADIDRVKHAIVATLQWVQARGYPRPEILEQYIEYIRRAEGWDGPLMAKTYDLEGPKEDVKIQMNIEKLNQKFLRVKSHPHMDFFLEDIAQILVREAWGLEIMKTRRAEIEKAGETMNAFGQAKRRLGIQRALVDYEDAIVGAATTGIAIEAYEELRQWEFLDWAHREGLYDPERAQRSFKNLLLDPGEISDETFVRLYLTRYDADELWRTRGELDEITRSALQFFLVRAFTENKSLEDNSEGDAMIGAYFHYGLLEMARFNRSGGREGLDIEGLRVVPTGKIFPDLEHFDSSTERIYPGVRERLLNWEEQNLAAPDRILDRERAPPQPSFHQASLLTPHPGPSGAALVARLERGPSIQIAMAGSSANILRAEARSVRVELSTPRASPSSARSEARVGMDRIVQMVLKAAQRVLSSLSLDGPDEGSLDSEEGAPKEKPAVNLTQKFFWKYAKARHHVDDRGRVAYDEIIRVRFLDAAWTALLVLANGTALFLLLASSVLGIPPPLAAVILALYLPFTYLTLPRPVRARLHALFGRFEAPTYATLRALKSFRFHRLPFLVHEIPLTPLEFILRGLEKNPEQKIFSVYQALDAASIEEVAQIAKPEVMNRNELLKKVNGLGSYGSLYKAAIAWSPADKHFKVILYSPLPRSEARTFGTVGPLATAPRPPYTKRAEARVRQVGRSAATKREKRLAAIIRRGQSEVERRQFERAARLLDKFENALLPADFKDHAIRELIFEAIPLAIDSGQMDRAGSWLDELEKAVAPVKAITPELLERLTALRAKWVLLTDLLEALKTDAPAFRMKGRIGSGEFTDIYLFKDLRGMPKVLKVVGGKGWNMSDPVEFEVVKAGLSSALRFYPRSEKTGTVPHIEKIYKTRSRDIHQMKLVKAKNPGTVREDAVAIWEEYIDGPALLEAVLEGHISLKEAVRQFSRMVRSFRREHLELWDYSVLDNFRIVLSRQAPPRMVLTDFGSVKGWKEKKRPEAGEPGTEGSPPLNITIAAFQETVASNVAFAKRKSRGRSRAEARMDNPAVEILKRLGAGEDARMNQLRPIRIGSRDYPVFTEDEGSRIVSPTSQLMQIGPYYLLPLPANENSRAFKQRLEGIEKALEGLPPHLKTSIFLSTFSHYGHSNATPISYYTLGPLAVMDAYGDLFKDAVVFDVGAGPSGLHGQIALEALGAGAVVFMENKESMFRVTQLLQARGRTQNQDFYLYNTGATLLQWLSGQFGFSRRKLDRFLIKQGLQNRPIIVVMNIGPWPQYGEANEKFLKIFSGHPNVRLIINGGFFLASPDDRDSLNVSTSERHGKIFGQMAHYLGQQFFYTEEHTILHGKRIHTLSRILVARAQPGREERLTHWNPGLMFSRWVRDFFPAFSGRAETRQAGRSPAGKSVLSQPARGETRWGRIWNWYFELKAFEKGGKIYEKPMAVFIPFMLNLLVNFYPVLLQRYLRGKDLGLLRHLEERLKRDQAASISHTNSPEKVTRSRSEARIENRQIILRHLAKIIAEGLAEETEDGQPRMKLMRMSPTGLLPVEDRFREISEVGTGAESDQNFFEEMLDAKMSDQELSYLYETLLKLGFNLSAPDFEDAELYPLLIEEFRSSFTLRLPFIEVRAKNLGSLPTREEHFRHLKTVLTDLPYTVARRIRINAKYDRGGGEEGDPASVFKTTSINEAHAAIPKKHPTLLSALWETFIYWRLLAGLHLKYEKGKGQEETWGQMRNEVFLKIRRMVGPNLHSEEAMAAFIGFLNSDVTSDEFGARSQQWETDKEITNLALDILKDLELYYVERADEIREAAENIKKEEKLAEAWLGKIKSLNEKIDAIPSQGTIVLQNYAEAIQDVISDALRMLEGFTEYYPFLVEYYRGLTGSGQSEKVEDAFEAIRKILISIYLIYEHREAREVVSSQGVESLTKKSAEIASLINKTESEWNALNSRTSDLLLTFAVPATVFWTQEPFVKQSASEADLDVLNGFLNAWRGIRARVEDDMLVLSARGPAGEITERIKRGPSRVDYWQQTEEALKRLNWQIQVDRAIDQAAKLLQARAETRQPFSGKKGSESVPSRTARGEARVQKSEGIFFDDDFLKSLKIEKIQDSYLTATEGVTISGPNSSFVIYFYANGGIHGSNPPSQTAGDFSWAYTLVRQIVERKLHSEWQALWDIAQRHFLNNKIREAFNLGGASLGNGLYEIQKDGTAFTLKIGRKYHHTYRDVIVHRDGRILLVTSYDSGTRPLQPSGEERTALETQIEEVLQSAPDDLKSIWEENRRSRQEAEREFNLPFDRLPHREERNGKQVVVLYQEDETRHEFYADGIWQVDVPQSSFSSTSQDPKDPKYQGAFKMVDTLIDLRKSNRLKGGWLEIAEILQTHREVRASMAVFGVSEPGKLPMFTGFAGQKEAITFVLHKGKGADGQPLELHGDLVLATGIIRIKKSWLSMEYRPPSEAEEAAIEQAFEHPDGPKQPSPVLFEAWQAFRAMREDIKKTTGMDPFYIPRPSPKEGDLLVYLADNKEWIIVSDKYFIQPVAGSGQVLNREVLEELKDLALRLSSYLGEAQRELIETAVFLNQAALEKGTSLEALPRGYRHGEVSYIETKLEDGRPLVFNELGYAWVGRDRRIFYLPDTPELQEIEKQIKHLEEIFGLEKGQSPHADALKRALLNARQVNEWNQIPGMGALFVVAESGKIPSITSPYDPLQVRDADEGPMLLIVTQKGDRILLSRHGDIQINGGSYTDWLKTILRGPSRQSDSEFLKNADHQTIIRMIEKTFETLAEKPDFDADQSMRNYWKQAKERLLHLVQNGFDRSSLVPSIISGEENPFAKRIRQAGKSWDSIQTALYLPPTAKVWDAPGVLINPLGQIIEISVKYRLDYLNATYYPSGWQYSVDVRDPNPGEMALLMKLMERSVQVKPELADIWRQIQDGWQKRNLSPDPAAVGLVADTNLRPILINDLPPSSGSGGSRQAPSPGRFYRTSITGFVGFDRRLSAPNTFPPEPVRGFARRAEARERGEARTEARAAVISRAEMTRLSQKIVEALRPGNGRGLAGLEAERLVVISTSNLRVLTGAIRSEMRRKMNEVQGRNDARILEGAFELARRLLGREAAIPRAGGGDAERSRPLTLAIQFTRTGRESFLERFVQTVLENGLRAEVLSDKNTYRPLRRIVDRTQTGEFLTLRGMEPREFSSGVRVLLNGNPEGIPLALDDPETAGLLNEVFLGLVLDPEEVGADPDGQYAGELLLTSFLLEAYEILNDPAHRENIRRRINAALVRAESIGERIGEDRKAKIAKAVKAAYVKGVLIRELNQMHYRVDQKAFTGEEFGYLTLHFDALARAIADYQTQAELAQAA